MGRPERRGESEDLPQNKIGRLSGTKDQLKRMLLHITLLGGIVFPALAQDTLPIVTVQAARDALWTPGRTETRMDMMTDGKSCVESVAESMKRLATVHLREYSPGSVASFSTRGASSAQNAILWNGYNINSSGTGLTDLSLLQSGFFSMVQSPGGAAPQYGSGAVGSILFLYQPVSEKPFSLELNQSIGSFGQQGTNIRAQWSKDRLLFSTKIGQSSARNDFEYENPLNADQKLKRSHAGFQHAAFSQLVAYELNKHHSIEVESFFTYGFRETPANTLVQSPSAATLNDRILRNRIDYHFQKKKSTLNLGYAYFKEWQEYQDPIIIDANEEQLRDTNLSYSHIAKADYTYLIKEKWAFTAAWQMRLDEVSGSNREGKQNVHSLSTGVRYGSRKWISALYLRSENWDGVAQPIMPQLSAEWSVAKTWKVASRIGKHFRLPTLNDRYWNPGGNPNLLPESGYSTEVNVQKEFAIGKSARLVSCLSGYGAHTDNYIIWLPGNQGVFSPENVRTVDSRGFELMLKYTLKLNNGSLQAYWESAFVDAKVLSSYLENDHSVGRQLIYQPKWKHSAHLNWGLKAWTFRIENVYTGALATNYSHGILDAFNLTNMVLGREMNFGKTTWNLRFTCQNVWNVRYATIPYFPMPGRNFLLTFGFQL
jgi:vitamin B12 transporter